MMDRAYWDRLAESYEAEIFSVLAHDRSGLVARTVRRYGNKNQTATDIGCGIGHFLPLLSGRFRRVFAVDYSSRCLARARKRHAGLANVSYRTVDLAAPRARLPKADFALCVNAVICPSLADRNRMLDVVGRHLRPGAHLVLVVPALESSLLADFRLIEWNLRNGVPPRRAVRAGPRPDQPARKPRVHEGVVPVDRVETKHFLREEMVALLERRGLRPRQIEKIEYPWSSEFATPPRWMQAPYPWDWLFVAQKG